MNINNEKKMKIKKIQPGLYEAVINGRTFQVVSESCEKTEWHLYGVKGQHEGRLYAGSEGAKTKREWVRDLTESPDAHCEEWDDVITDLERWEAAKVNDPRNGPEREATPAHWGGSASAAAYSNTTDDKSEYVKRWENHIRECVPLGWTKDPALSMEVLKTIDHLVVLMKKVADTKDLS